MHLRGQQVLDQLRQSSLSDREQLREINRLSLAAGYGKIDHAMRLWAEENEDAATAVTKADRNLLYFIEEKLTNLGLSKADARLLAELAVTSGVGYFTMGDSLESRNSEAFDKLFDELIAARLD